MSQPYRPYRYSAHDGSLALPILWKAPAAPKYGVGRRRYVDMADVLAKCAWQYHGPALDHSPQMSNPWGSGELLQADKGYDVATVGRSVAYRALPPICRRRIESSERLGRIRWVVERAFAWLTRLRRLRIRDERHADILSPSCNLAARFSSSLRLNRLRRRS
jgi:hypothetical protein